MSCQFCNINQDQIIKKNKFSFAIYDKYPVTKGHLLIISKEHIRDYFTASSKLKKAIFELTEECKTFLDKKYKPDGYNIGLNCGKEAGQTIMHLHLHLIPRYEGDIEDPTGGVRGVIPKKRVY